MKTIDLIVAAFCAHGAVSDYLKGEYVWAAVLAVLVVVNLMDYARRS